MHPSEYCDVNYDEINNVVFVKWKKFCCDEDYRKQLQYAIDIIKTHEDCHYVADTRDGFENEPEDTKWIFETFLPEAKEAGCKYVFFIIDQDNSLKEELEGQSSELSKAFTVRYCYGMDEVSDMLKELRQN